MEFMEPLLVSYQSALERFLPMIQKKSKGSYIGAALILITLQRIYSYLKVPKSLRHIPSLPYFATALSYYKHESPQVRFKNIVLPKIKDNNGIYVSKIPFEWTVHIANPVVAKHVLLKADSYPKSNAFLDMMGPDSPFVQFLGYDNVAILNGRTWKNHRKVINPAFHRSMPIKTMASVMPDLFSYIDKNGTVSAPITMKFFTLDVLGLTTFGFNFKALKGDPEQWSSTFKLVNDGMFDPLLNIMGSYSFLLKFFPEKRKQMEAVVKMNEKLAEMTKQKRKEIQQMTFSSVPENEKDLLTLMLESEQRGEGLITDEQLKHNIAGFFVAGHDTTAHALSFCLYNLAKHKRVQNKLREEINSFLGDNDLEVVPTLEQLKDMKYMNFVIKENLRCNGPVDTLLPRIASEDMIVDGTLIPKGTTVNLDIYALHNYEKYWTHSDQFIPERFEEENQENHNGWTWLPFSNGARQCVGMNFSLAEQRLALAMLVRRYEIDIPKDSIHSENVAMDMSKMFAPDSLELTFTKRY